MRVQGTAATITHEINSRDRETNSKAGYRENAHFVFTSLTVLFTKE